MAPGGLRSKRVKNDIPTFSPVLPNYNSPIKKGLLGLQKRANNLQNVSNLSEKRSEIRPEVGVNHGVVVESIDLPESPTNQVSGDQSTETASTEIGSSSQKRGRGLTMGKGVMKSFITSGNKMKIDVDPSIRRPANANQSAKFASQIGVVSRDVLPVPKKWKDIDKEKDLKPVIDHLNIHIDINTNDPGVMDSLIYRVQNSTRQQRYRYHKHFLKYSTLEEAKRHRPQTCDDQVHWEIMCDHFTTEKFKNASRVNTNNRKELKAPHITGRKAFTVRLNEIQNERNGDPCDAIELYQRTHHSNQKGWSTKEAEKNWNMMKEKEDRYKQDGITKTADEIVREVLGRASGYIKGLGYGPKPPSTRTNDFVAQQLENELLETREKLKTSEAKVEELTSTVSSMQSKLSEQEDQMRAQGADIEKLMAFMVASGTNTKEN